MTSMCLCLLGGDLVQTGVVWEGVRGILLDTETAECNMRRDIFFWRKENRKEREKQRKKEKKKETSDKCSFLPGKSNTFLGRLKPQIKQKREKQSIGRLR